jgi:hypothetical protein
MRLEEDNKQYEGKLKRAVLNGEGGEGEAYKQIQVGTECGKVERGRLINRYR